MTILINKFKEVLFSVLPITVIVLILNFTLTPLETPILIKFLIGAFLIIIGLAIFLFGVDIGITPIGTSMGSALAKSNKIWIIAIGGLILGFFITIAEPGLLVLAEQISSVTSGLIAKSAIVMIVSLGIAAMISLGMIRIVRNIPFYKFITVVYLLIFIISLFSSPEFLAISFDASGAATGVLTVPFILALALGVSGLKKDSKAAEEDSFGLVSLAASGVTIFVMIIGILSNTTEITGSLEYSFDETSSIISPFIHEIKVVLVEAFIALLPLLILFLIFQKISFKLKKKAFRKILKGILYAYIGLVLFLTGVNAGFMDVGSLIGYELANLDNLAYVVIVGFIVGLVTILAEPSVHVLTQQIEEVTSGYVKTKAVLFALSIGVGTSLALSIIRIIVPGIQLWHYLLPGYATCIILSYFVPKLFVGMSFDSGTVSSGPMTATFILAFAQGVAEGTEGANVLIEGFGTIAMVTMTPVIALQILGLIFKIKSAKGGLETNAR